MPVRPRSVVVASVALSVALATGATGCSSDSSSSTPATTAAAAATTTAAGDTSSSTGTVSANDASQSEIAAALEAAGVENADRWAGEVVEYRPYDDAAQGFPRLREELQKYNPADGVIDAIIGVLQ